MAADAKIAYVDECVTLSFAKGTNSLPAEHKLYLVSVLGAKRNEASDSYVFTKDTVGVSDLAELVGYLNGNGYRTNVDNKADVSLDFHSKLIEQHEEAVIAGQRIKKNPPRAFLAKGFARRLKTFQIGPAQHMSVVTHAANFSVPGSGKTTIALASYMRSKQQGLVERLVVVGPRACFGPWESEYRACLKIPGKVVRIWGSWKGRNDSWEKARFADLVLLNYNVAQNDRPKLEKLLKTVKTMLVLDESHYIKNIGDGKWAKTLQSVAPLAAKRVILSGTPAPNGLTDLWSQVNFLYPDLDILGEKENFRRRVEELDPTVVSETKQELRPLFWRIRKSELGLPRPKVHRISIATPKIQRSIYAALASKVLSDFAKTPSDVAQLKLWRRAKMIRLLQAASNPSLLARYSDEFKMPPLSAAGVGMGKLISNYPDFEVPGKIRAVVRLAARLVSEKKKVIIWTSFIHNLHMLSVLLKELNPLLLYGGVSSASENGAVESERERVVAKFKKGGMEYPLLLANPAACAESISLHQVCHEAVYLDRSFNCAHYLQSRDRIHRVGLPLGKTTNYYLFIAKGTIDEVVDWRLEEKFRKMTNLLEQEFARVSLELDENVVSEDDSEEIDFNKTLEHIRKNFGA